MNRPSTFSLYLSEIKRRPRLSLEEETALAERRHDHDQEAYRTLVEANLGFVVRVASEFRNLGLPMEDLINEGNLGLLEAAKRYEPSRGFKFTTYAVWWIRKSILKALGEQTRVVRVPAYHIRQRKERHRSGSRDMLPQASLREISLDERIGEDRDMSLGDRLADSAHRSPEASLLGSEAQQLVEEAIGQLSAQQRTVIQYRFGLAGERPLVLKQIGDRLGISRERVRQIEVQAKDRMRRYLARRSIQDPGVTFHPAKNLGGVLSPAV
jgi:RNA polymerase sigma factor (sigma-70 family)